MLVENTGLWHFASMNGKDVSGRVDIGYVRVFVVIYSIGYDCEQ